ncbi:MAG: serine hydrolase domain-containing protein [Candidatus Limnocylindrales bacterium]
MIPGRRSSRGRDARALNAVFGLVLAAGLAACGSTTPSPVITLPPTPAPTPAISVSVSPSPTASPSAIANLVIVPVPTSRFAAPGPAAASLTAATAAALQKELDAIRASGSYPGVSAAIVFPDGSLWTGHSGKAILSPQTPVTADTLFSIGSISKTFVAATLGRLAQRGTIGLDDPLSKYLPDFPNAAGISLRQMLNHTSGIREPFDDQSMADAILANPAQSWTTAQVLSWIGGTPYFAPGAGYHYSNANFILLGEVIEKATGQSLASLVRSEFLTPLGLAHTFLQTEETVTGAKAHGFMAPASRPRDNSAGTMIPFTAEATAFGPAGAFVSTPTDLARWASALYGGNVLDQATLAAMVDISPTQPYIVKPARTYGLGLEETTVDGQVAWGHLGYLDGFFSAMEYLPASHVAIVVLENASWGNPIGAASKLAKVALVPAAVASPSPA